MLKFFRFVKMVYVMFEVKRLERWNKLPHMWQRILALLWCIVLYPITVVSFVVTMIFMLIATRGYCLDITEEEIRAGMETY